jgi:uncharacterized protein (TIGR02646 family)
MIQLESKPTAPSDFSSKKTDNISEKISNGIEITQKDYEHYNKKNVKKVLLKHQNFKCCFCECKININSCEICLYRPVGFLSDDPGKQHVGPPYWWLAYDWNNFFVTCSQCKAKKNDQFPLLDGGIRAESPTDDLSKENPFLIHPILDKPEEYITFDWKRTRLFVKAKGIDRKGRGKKTINALTDINRNELLKERARIILELEQDYEVLKNAKESENLEELEESYNNILKHTEKGVLFSGLRNEFFKEIENDLELIRRNIIKNYPAQSKKISHVGVATSVSIVEWINEKITPEICKKYCNKKHKLKANEAFMIAFITDILSGFQLGIPIATLSVFFIKFFEIILDKMCECNEYAY